MAGKKIIGCIGAGNMGGAILSRLAASVGADLLTAFDTDAKRLGIVARNTGIRTSSSSAELAQASRIIIIAVKPDAVTDVLNEIKESLSSESIIACIAAGGSILTLEKIAGASAKIVRVMSNQAAMGGGGL